MKKGYITAIVVAIMSFVLALTMGVYILVTSLNKEVKYVLYVGVSQENSAGKMNAIEDQIDEICRTHTDGYTKVEAEGGFRNDDNVFIKEKTFVYTFCFTNEATVEAIAKKILAEVEGSTILMETIENKAVHSSLGVFNQEEQTAE